MEIKSPRSKTFISMDSLWYEEERLATFIDWPVPFISPRELAQEGFYYLRTKDHCACAFCRGIIGAWEEGDTPRGEHKRHFPHCPFVQGKVTPNVPLTQGSILARISREIIPDNTISHSSGVDICGTGKKEKLEYSSEGMVLTKSSNPEISLSSLGFRQYCGPKRKEYLTSETRLNSFKHWPEKVRQTPENLAEAGFYYCGLSDHVRCFHCGNGLRNWEPDDDPWEEHARWFPDCHYVLLQKGIEFVDKVRRERPPYIPVRGRQSLNAASSSTKKPFDLSDDEMNQLMELQIMKHVLEMGFSAQVVKKALRKRLTDNGQPFFSVEACIDAVLLVMEEETKNTIHGCEDITSQARKMAEYCTAATPSSNTSGPASSTQASSSQETSVRSLPTLPNNVRSHPPKSPLPSLPNNTVTVASPVSLPPLPNNIIESPPLRSSTPTPQEEPVNTSQAETNSPPQSMDLEHTSDVTELSNNLAVSQPNGIRQMIESGISATPESSTNSDLRNNHDPSMEIPTEVAPLISEADDVMEEAAKLLGTSSSSASSSSQPSSQTSDTSSQSSSLQTSETSSQPSSLTSSIPDSEEELKHSAEEKSSTSVLRRVQHVASKDSENLALELERIRENRMCKVCMDKEMDVVFLPCTHMVTCSSCAVALAACPICRREIQYAFKPIIS